MESKLNTNPVSTAVEVRSCHTCNNLSQSLNTSSALCWDCSSFKTLVHWEPREESTLSRLEYSALHEAVEEEPTSALNSQVGGSHYKDLKIQPVQFIHANNIPFLEGNIIKYVCRWKAKNGIKDLEKAKHYIELLLEMEGKQDGF